MELAPFVALALWLLGKLYEILDSLEINERYNLGQIGSVSSQTFGTVFPKRPISILPAASPPMVMSNQTLWVTWGIKCSLDWHTHIFQSHTCSDSIKSRFQSQWSLVCVLFTLGPFLPSTWSPLPRRTITRISVAAQPNALKYDIQSFSYPVWQSREEGRGISE